MRKRYSQSRHLQCEWSSWVVTGRRMLSLHLRDGDCCNMEGAVAVATFLMPTVQVITVYSGVNIDVQYLKPNGKEWVAV